MNRNNKVRIKRIKQIMAVGVCISMMSVGLVKNVKGTAVFYAIAETQERSRWCWVASARGVARGETTVTASQADAVLAVKGNVVDKEGTAEETMTAVKYYSPNSDFVLYENALTFNQIKACIDNGHLVLTMFYPTSYSSALCGHAMFIIGYNDGDQNNLEIRYCDPADGVTRWYPYEYYKIISTTGTAIYEYEKSIFCRLK